MFSMTAVKWAEHYGSSVPLALSLRGPMYCYLKQLKRGGTRIRVLGYLYKLGAGVYRLDRHDTQPSCVSFTRTTRCRAAVLLLRE